MPEPLKPGSLYHFLREYSEHLIRLDDFPRADRTLGGAIGWCPVLLSKLVLLMGHHGWSERETVRRARMDMQVKACLGLGLEQAGPSQPTLSRHVNRMQELGLVDVYQRRLEELLEVMGLISAFEAVLVDTVPIHGAGQQLDSYNLLAGALTHGLRALAKAERRSLEDVAAELDMRAYLARSVKGQFDIDWSDESARIAFLGTLVADARRVLKRLDESRTRQDGDDDQEPPSASQLADARAAIVDIIEHDVAFDDSGEVQGIRQQPAGDRRISLTDPDMRHGRKSASRLIVGFKAQIVATLLYGFILTTKVIKANRHDGADLPNLVGDLKERGYRPDWWSGDTAYGTIDNHRHFREQSCGELVAKIHRPTNGGRFTKDMFEYSFESRMLTCPMGQSISPTKWKKVHGKKGLLFEFDEHRCRTCPRRKQCVSPQAKISRRSVFIVEDDERLIREHLAKRKQPEFRQRLRQRVGVEHAIAGFAQCGGKQARRFGIDNVSFDVKVSAFTYNLRRLGSLLRKHETLQSRLAEAVGSLLRFIRAGVLRRLILRRLANMAF